MNNNDIDKENTNNQPSIYCGKLISGELIIGRLQNNNLINCLKINASYDIVTSNFNINFTPILFPISNSLETIPLNSCILLKPAEEDIIKLYINNLLIYVNQELIKNTNNLNGKINNLENNSNIKNDNLENNSTNEPQELNNMEIK